MNQKAREDKIFKFVKGKNIVVVFFTYLFCVLVIDILFGMSTESLWDRLIEYSK